MESGDSLSTVEFLQMLYGNVGQGAIEVTYIAPDGVKVYPHVFVQWADLPLGRDIDPEFPVIRHNNLKGYGVYFGVAVRKEAKLPYEKISEKTGKPYLFYPRGHQKDALCITALWVDIDAKDGGTLADINKGGNRPFPSIVVSSGGGWHAYWLLNEPLIITDENRDMVHRTLKGLAKACNADTKVADLARVLRLPGTVNTKPDRGGVICEVIEYMDVRYSYMDFELNNAPLVAPATPRILRNIPQEARLGLPKHVVAFVEHGATFGDGRNDTVHTCARHYNDAGYPQSQAEQDLIPAACGVGLTEQEARTAINSAYRYTANPQLNRRDHLMIAANDRLLDAKRKLRGA